ncbi:MAG: CopD family protein, partial [Gammaproteobacteria bacterium]|nr:CopD family protein [Gammaproteobacteria bacterium]
LGFGIWLWLGYGFSGNWLYAKLAFVGLLMGYHHLCMRYLKKMRENAALPGSVFFRIFNESALLIYIPILILVFIKPF